MKHASKLRIPNGGSSNTEIRIITPINQQKGAEEVDSVDVPLLRVGSFIDNTWSPCESHDAP